MAYTHRDYEPPNGGQEDTSCDLDMPNLNEGAGDFSGTHGGYFVPPELSQDVNQIIRDGGCVEGFAKHYPMRRLELILRKFATGVDGYWVGAECVKEKDAPSFELVTLHAEKMAVIVPFEDQLLEDADHDMAALVSTDVTGAFIEAVDRTFLGYEITSPFPDSLSGNTPAAHTVIYGTDVDLAGDISEAISAIEGDGFEATGMITHPRIKHLLRNLRDLNNQPIFSERLDACIPRERYCVFGVPICFTRQVAAQLSPAGYEILIAYFPYVFVGDRTGLTVAISNEATLTSGSLEAINLFEQDMTAYRFVIRKAFAIKDDNALAKVTGVPAI
jgi:HK97 family phage major capsid protein